MNKLLSIVALILVVSSVIQAGRIFSKTKNDLPDPHEKSFIIRVNIDEQVVQKYAQDSQDPQSMISLSFINCTTREFDLVMKYFFNNQKNNNIISLDFSDSYKMTPDQLHTITSLCPKLISLNIEYHTPTSSHLIGSNYLFNFDHLLASNTYLQKLRITLSADNYDIRHFTRLQDFKFLRSLTITFMRRSSEPPYNSDLSFLNEMIELQELTLIDARITNDFWEILTGLTHLQSLNLLKSSIMQQTGSKSLSKLTNLKTLIIQGDSFNSNNLINEDLHAIAQLKNLETLNIEESSDITNAGLMALNPRYDDNGFLLSGCPRLKILNLAGCENISDKGLQFLPALKDLSILNLNGCSKPTLRYIAKLKNLQDLDLALNESIKNQDLEVLTHLPNLRILGLRCCKQITDDALPHLTKLTKLQKIDLTGCDISNEGLIRLAKSLPRLQQLTIQRNENITTLVEQLQRIAPHCIIELD